MLNWEYMQTFFVLGREPGLSIAEILAVSERLTGSKINPAESLVSREIFVSELSLSSKELMRELGGTIKIGQVLHSFRSLPPEEDLLEFLQELLSAPRKKKFQFGFSVYDASAQGLKSKELARFRKDIRKLGISLKRKLAKAGGVRFVTSREPTLSSVVISENKLISEGKEIVFLHDGSKLQIGLTEAVQPWKDFGKRDYDRPGRDPKSGMLPPKLARMMINLAGASITATLADPFCGSGTLITEALLLGYRSLVASDIDSTALARTETNVEWLVKRGDLDKTAVQNLRFIDIGIAHLPNALERGRIDAVVTEPFLGPALRGKKTREEIEKIAKQLEPLYHDMLVSVRAILKLRGKAVIAFPLWKTKNRESIHSPVLRRLEKYGFALRPPVPTPLIVPSLAPEFGLNGKTLIYGRKDQKVFREIVILEKIS